MCLVLSPTLAIGTFTPRRPAVLTDGLQGFPEDFDRFSNKSRKHVTRGTWMREAYGHRDLAPERCGGGGCGRERGHT